MYRYNIIVLWSGLKGVETFSIYAKSMSQALSIVESSLETGIIISCTIDNTRF